MKKFLIFVSSGFESLELSPFIDTFGWNNVINKEKIFPVLCSIKEHIKSSWVLEIKTNVNLKSCQIDINEYEALVIPGGFGMNGYFEDIQTPEFKNLVQQFLDKQKIVIGICTGSLALAINGFLENIPATTYLLDNKRYFNQLEKYSAIPVEENIVYSENIVTSSGPSTAIPLSFYLLEQLSSREKMEKVKFNMGF